MKAEVVRYLPRGASEPVTRLVIPSKKLIVWRNKHVQRGTIARGEILGQLDVDKEFVERVEHALAAQEALARQFHRPDGYEELGNLFKW